MQKREESKKTWSWYVWAVIGLTIFMLLSAGARTVHADMAYGFILPNESSAYLTEADIAGMSLQTVCYAKNEIYARNGRIFQSQELQDYFNSQYWYCGIYSPEQFTQNMLNTYESANVELLSSREAALGGYPLDSGYYDYTNVYQYVDSYYAGNYVDPDSYIFYDSDKRYLGQSEISQLSLQEINYAKNEIYARRGRLFQSTELANYFGQKNWYWGYIDPNSFSSALLNGYETANADALEKAEFSRQSGGYPLDQTNYAYGSVGSYDVGYTYQTTANDYIIWDSNIRYLSSADIAGLSLQQLNYARNEIYARRGYVFQSQELRDYFGSQYWYYGTLNQNQFSNEVFNVYEKANIELLKNYEYSINSNGYQLY